MTPFPLWHWNIPEYFNIGVACTDAHLSTAVAKRAAVIVDDDAHGISQLTYAELADLSNRFGELLHGADVDVGDRVLIRLPNCIEYAPVFLGAMKRGAIPVPTSTLLTADEVVYLAQDSGARAIVLDRASWAAVGARLEQLEGISHAWIVGAGPAPSQILPRAAGEAITPDRIILADLDDEMSKVVEWHDPYPTRADDPAYLVYTSGTTGYPKGVLHAHRVLLGKQPSSTYWFDFDPAGDRVLHSGKYNWTYVLGTGLMDPLYRGHTTIVHEGAADAGLWPRLIARHEATIFIGVPTLYRQILQKTPTKRTDLPSLRHCMCAGEQLSAELLQAWRERMQMEIYEGLGMTECSYYMCETRSRPIRPGSAGFVQPGHEIELLDPETMEEVPSGTEGMLCIPRSDPALMLRYWNQPDETARCFRGDWFLTGDYARYDEDGYIWFLGRKDDLINTFGYRVSPFEVERVLKEHPAVADAAAVGEEIEPGKILVAAYVVARPEARLNENALLDYGHEHLAAYKAPRKVYLVDDLPRTRNGKVLRRALRPPT